MGILFMKTPENLQKPKSTNNNSEKKRRNYARKHEKETVESRLGEPEKEGIFHSGTPPDGIET